MLELFLHSLQGEEFEEHLGEVLQLYLKLLQRGLVEGAAGGSQVL